MVRLHRALALFAPLALLAPLAPPALAGRPAGEPPAPAPPQSAPTDADEELARKVVDVLRRGDAPALAALVDFERRADERLQRGLGTQPWSALDDEAQMLERRDACKAWTASNYSYNRDASLRSVEALADPDAGLGPVPDRRILRVVMTNTLAGRERELLLVLAPDGLLLDLVLGEPYYAGANPAGASGLLPKPMLSLEIIPEVQWPAGADEAARAEAGQRVQALLDSPPGEPRDAALAALLADPHTGVAALVDHLRHLETQPEPDVPREALLDLALRRITGRPSTYAVEQPAEASPQSWRAGNHAAVAAWLRWQHQNGSDFVAVPIASTPELAGREKRGSDAGSDLAGWDDALAKQSAESEAAANAPPKPEGGAPGAPGATGGPPRPGEPGGDGGVAVAPPGVPSPPPASEPPASEPPASEPPESEPAEPSVVLRGATPPEREILFPAAADMKVLHNHKEVTGRSLEKSLSPAVREALNFWAEPAGKLGLRIVVSGGPEQIVIGGARDQMLEDAAAWMDEAFGILDPLVPTVGDRLPRATVAFVFDEKGIRSKAWTQLLDLLVEKQLLLEEDATRVHGEPAGLTRRAAPFFIQPTYDITGEGEFQLPNEIVHKFAQCLLTARAGEQPPNILWGVGEMVEIKLYKTVYQLNATGFVNTSDHFDWPVRTRQYLDKHQKNKDWSLPRLAAFDAVAGQPQEPQMVTWAVIAWLAAREPATLRELLTELGALHDRAWPGGGPAVYGGDPGDTRAVLEDKLGPLDPDVISAWLHDEF